MKLAEKAFLWMVGIAGLVMVVWTAYNVITDPVLVVNTCTTYEVNLVPIFVSGMIFGMAMLLVPAWFIMRKG